MIDNRAIVAVVVVAVVAMYVGFSLAGENNSSAPEYNPVVVNVDSNEVNLSDVDSAIDEIKKSGKNTLEVVIPSSATSDEKTTAKVSADVMSKLSTAGANLTVTTDTGSVTLDKKTVKSLVDENVSVTVGVTTDTEEASTVLGSKYAGCVTAVITVDLSGSEAIHELDGKAVITIPYTLQSGEDANAVKVWYKESDGTITEYVGTYVDGYVSFTVDHFSSFFISFISIEDIEIPKDAIKTIDEAELKVFGNVNGDDTIDETDVTMLNKMVLAEASAATYSAADANQDGKIDADDVAILKAIINGETTTVYHINYHDTNEDGVMDTEIVSTVFPITSVIISGSANIGMLCQMLDIVDEVKGAAYSGTSLDKTLYKDNFLNTSKVEKLGTSATTIKIEDGKIGASETIASKNVTALISDWNKTYITNESAFEDMGVDVVRIAASALDKDTYTNTILTLGFLFQKEDAAQGLVALYDECFALAEQNASDGSLAGVAASMNGYFSSPDSDYTAVLLKAGLSYGLEGFDFGGKTSIKAADNLDVYNTEKYDYDYIVHIRTAADYGNTLTYDTKISYANSFPLWKYQNGEHQYIVSGAIPVPLRVLYTECIFSSTISKADVDALHQRFIDNFFDNKNFEAAKIQFFADCSEKFYCIASIDDADLKVFGNVNGDDTIDETDLTNLQYMIEAGVTAAKYPVADVNQDGSLDSTDVEVLTAIVNRETATVYHVNYHDTDEDGVMDTEIVSTVFPITSVIISGSANIGMLCQMLDIVDEVKGAAYSKTSLDATLYKDNFLNTSKVEKLGTSATTIKIEDGKIGASETISQKKVTALISDWNKTYITNEADFEAMGVDVVRIAASALDEDTYTNTILTLGFLFQKEDAAQALVALYDECFDLAEKNASDGSLSGVAASMNGYFSSADSDYTAVLLEAGLSFGLEGFDFGGKTSIKAIDNLEVYNTEKYDFDYIVHIRTAADYGGTLSQSTVQSYANSFELWQYSFGEHQYIVSGAIPVPLRVLYTECIFSDSLNKGTVDALHQRFIDNFFDNKDFDATKIEFFVSCAEYFDISIPEDAIKTLDDAELKVFGNVNGDDTIDSTDLAMLNKMIRAGASAEEYPAADANQDKKIDADDRSVVTKIIAGLETEVYHISYHDVNADGTMDTKIVSTTFPLTSVIISGSANVGMALQMLGIVEEVKGAAYSATSLDSALYATTYLDTEKVEKIGTSATTISFEDGKIGTSEIIAQKGVTALISDWNRSYIKNESAFEDGGVDVVRVACSALDKDTYTNSILTLGFLFQKEETAQALVDLYDECFALIAEKAGDGTLKGVASSSTGAFSSGTSDYTAVLTTAGLSFGLEGFDFGSSASIKAADNLDVYNTDLYDYDYIIHLRTAVGYSGVDNDTVKTYADAFSLWKYQNGEHQYIVSGVIPVPLRILYVESIFNDSLTKDAVDALHQRFIDEFYAAKNFDASEIAFFVDCSTAYANA